MIPVPSGVRVWLAAGVSDMRRGMNGLALQVQQALERDPHVGDLYVFRGRRGDLVKILWYDGLGMSLYAKRLERGRFIWPQAQDGVVSLTPAMLSMLLEGIEAVHKLAAVWLDRRRDLRHRRPARRHRDAAGGAGGRAGGQAVGRGTGDGCGGDDRPPQAAHRQAAARPVRPDLGAQPQAARPAGAAARGTGGGCRRGRRRADRASRARAAPCPRKADAWAAAAASAP